MISNPAQCCQRDVLQHFPEFRDTKSITFHHKMSQEKMYDTNQCFLQGIKPNLCYFFQLSNRPRQCFFAICRHGITVLTVGYPQSVCVPLSDSQCLVSRFHLPNRVFHHSRSQLPLSQIQQSSRLKKKKKDKITANLWEQWLSGDVLKHFSSICVHH